MTLPDVVVSGPERAPRRYRWISAAVPVVAVVVAAANIATARGPETRRPAPSPTAAADRSVVYDKAVEHVDSALIASLRAIAAEGRSLVGPVTIELSEPPRAHEGWPVIAEGGDIVVPTPFFAEPVYPHNVEAIAFGGVALRAYDAHVRDSPTSLVALACARAFATLEKGGTFEQNWWSPPMRALWLGEHTHTWKFDPLPGVEAEHMYASGLMVLRYFEPEFTKAFRALSEPERRAVVDFMDAVADTFGDRRPALLAAVPALARLLGTDR